MNADRGHDRSVCCDASAYKMSNIIGALVGESVAVLSAVGQGMAISDVQAQALDGTLFHHRSWQTRRRFWHAIHARYLADQPRWVLQALCKAAASGPHDPTALGLLYTHFVLGDALTRDWILGPVWSMWERGDHRMVRDDVLSDLDRLTTGADIRWTEGSRKKLATSLLSSLRDFGIATGVQVKHLRKPVLPTDVSEHLVRLMIERGVRGGAVLDHPYWRLFFRTQDDAAGVLATLALDERIRFERAGSTVVLETPWSQP